MTDWASWISATGTVVAAGASAVAAWHSSKSSKAAADEAKRIQEQADIARRQVASERLMLAAESLCADMRRAATHVVEIKQLIAIAMVASGVRQHSGAEEGRRRAEGWLDEVKGLTAMAVKVGGWGASKYSELSPEQTELIRVDMARSKERVVVVLEEMRREHDGWQQSIDRMTQVKAAMQ